MMIIIVGSVNFKRKHCKL